MNKRECIVILLLSTIITCFSEHISAVAKQQRTFWEDGKYKLSENDFKERGDVNEDGFYQDVDKDEPLESLDKDGNEELDYIPREINEDIADGKMPRIRSRIAPVNHDKHWTKGFHYPKMTQDYEEPIYIGDDDYLESNDDYVKQISYDPNLSNFRKQNERAKRLSSNQEDDSSYNLESENYLDGVDRKDAYKQLSVKQPIESGKETKEIEKSSEPIILPSKKSLPNLSSSSTKAAMIKSLVNQSASTTRTTNKGLLIKALKKSIALSAPKALNIPSGTTNGPSQGFRNVVELNKAYKLLICASNKFVKIANKTLTDRLIEECATANNVKSTTDLCKSRTTTFRSVTTEPNNGECCAKTSFSNLNYNSDDVDETEDSLVDEILEITLKPKGKKENMSKKGIFSWIQSHETDSYENLPVAKVPPSRDESSVYMYGDYDTADQDEDEALTTKTRARTISPTEIKVSSKSYDYTSKALIGTTACLRKNEDKELISKVVVANKSKSTTMVYPKRLATEMEVDGTYTSDVLLVGESPETSVQTRRMNRHKHRKHLKKSRRQKNIRSMNARRSRFNKKHIPIAFAETGDLENVTNQDSWESSVKSPSTSSSDDVAEPGEAFLPEQVYEEILFGG